MFLNSLCIVSSLWGLGPGIGSHWPEEPISTQIHFLLADVIPWALTLSDTQSAFPGLCLASPICAFISIMNKKYFQCTQETSMDWWHAYNRCIRKEVKLCLQHPQTLVLCSLQAYHVSINWQPHRHGQCQPLIKLLERNVSTFVKIFFVMTFPEHQARYHLSEKRASCEWLSQIELQQSVSEITGILKLLFISLWVFLQTLYSHFNSSMEHLR